MPAIELEQVTKTFGRHTAVADLSLMVPEGSIYGFIGPNGSGKTTTLRMIMRILHPDRGAIRILGQPVSAAAVDRVGYLPEERGLYRKMKVRELLVFYGGLKDGRDVPAEVDRWLARLGLADWADRKVEALSKGMSQKVQFIAAVAARPAVVLLDEPFTGLDPVNRDVMEASVRELKAGGATILFSTHDMAVAERLCDFIFMIFKGRKVLDGTLESIQDRYATDVVRVETEGKTNLEGLQGVDRVHDRGRFQELRLAPGVDPQAVAAALLARSRVRSFTVAKPSLHDIFIRIAGPEAGEAAGA